MAGLASRAGLGDRGGGESAACWSAANCARSRLRQRDRRRKRRRRRWRRGQGRFALDGVVMKTLLLSQSRYVPKIVGELTAFLASECLLDLSFPCMNQGDSVNFDS